MTRLYFQGCRRSGNHAIADWVMRHYRSATYYNNLPANWTGRFRPKDTIVHGDPPYELEVFAWEDKVLELPIRPIVILRSAYNCVASRMNGPKYLAKESRKISRFIPVWKAHARMVLELHPAIIYDRWLECPSMYHGLLDLPSKCLPIQENKPHFGSGSSFKDKPNSDYTERWKEVELPPEVVEDQELASLHEEIFGWSIEYV